MDVRQGIMCVGQVLRRLQGPKKGDSQILLEVFFSDGWMKRGIQRGPVCRDEDAREMIKQR